MFADKIPHTSTQALHQTELLQQQPFISFKPTNHLYLQEIKVNQRITTQNFTSYYCFSKFSLFPLCLRNQHALYHSHQYTCSSDRGGCKVDLACRHLVGHLLPGLGRGPTQGAGGVGAQPHVDALYMENMPTVRQQPHLLPLLHHADADHALR